MLAPESPPDAPADVSPPGPVDHLVERARQGLAPLKLAAAIAGCGVAAALVLGALRPAPVPPELTLPRAGAAAEPGGADVAGSSGRVVVHAAGALVTPGVYRLASGARIADLLDAAGGPLADADVDALNLAQLLADGERVYLPRKGELVVPGGAAMGSAKPPGPLNLNAATAEELDALPGVGPATASAIIEHRTRAGRFRSVDDLLDVPGIGEAKLERLRALVRV